MHGHGNTAASAVTVVLLNGQLLNATSVLTVGLLAEGLVQRTGSPGQARWAGIIAILVAGLLNPMPGFYVNWGRYSQLAGQVSLPPAILWTLLAWEPHRPHRELVPLVLVVSAVALSHYGVGAMFGVALVPLLAMLI